MKTFHTIDLYPFVNQVLMFGGQTIEGINPPQVYFRTLNDLWAYDPEEKIWVQVIPETPNGLP